MIYIPPMTHEFGKYWDAPDLTEIQFSLSHAWMPLKSFNKLHDYSHSLPTGVYEGKMWKKKGKDKWFLVWYGFSEDPSKCSINYLRIGILN